MAQINLNGWDNVNGVWRPVKVDASGRVVVSGGLLFENPPTEDEANKGPSSEWAFDHAANAAAHHAKYTDAESRAAIGGILDASGVCTGHFDVGYYNITHIKQTLMYDQGGGTGYGKYYYSQTLGRIIMRAYDSNGQAQDTHFQVYHDGAFQYMCTEVVADDKISTHAANASAHHTKYTDAEARTSFGASSVELSTGTYTDQSLSGKGMVKLDQTAGAITLKGFADGVTGQIVFVVSEGGASNVSVIHNSGDAAAGDKIRTFTATDLTLTGNKYGGFVMVYLSSYWNILGGLA